MKNYFASVKFSNFQHILFSERINLYLSAYSNDTRKTMTHYKLNLNLSQEVFILLSCFEVAVRNAIERILIERLEEKWLHYAVHEGGIFDVSGVVTVQES